MIEKYPLELEFQKEKDIKTERFFQIWVLKLGITGRIKIRDKMFFLIHFYVPFEQKNGEQLELQVHVMNVLTFSEVLVNRSPNQGDNIVILKITFLKYFVCHFEKFKRFNGACIPFSDDLFDQIII